jgi:hypothetical protein
VDLICSTLSLASDCSLSPLDCAQSYSCHELK